MAFLFCGCFDFFFLSCCVCLPGSCNTVVWSWILSGTKWGKKAHVHSVDCTASFFSYIPTIDQFFLFCLLFFFFSNSLANVSFSRYIYILFMTLSGLISVLHAACDSSCIMNEAAAAAADSLGTRRAYTYQHHWQLLTRKDFNTPAVLIALLARACFRKDLWQL